MGTVDKPGKRTFVFYTAGDYIHTPSTGGTRRYREMLEYFLEAGDEIYLLAPKNVDIQNHVHLHHIPIKTYRTRFLPNGLLNFLFNRKSFRIVKQLNTDGVVLFSVPYAIQCIWAGLKSIHLFIREDDVQNILSRSQIKNGAAGYLRELKLLFYKLIEKYTLKKSQKIVVQSNHAKNVLMVRYHAIWKTLEKKTYVLHNNVNSRWILRCSGYIRQMSLQRKEVYYFVFVGAINNRIKGLHVLLEAARYLLDKEYPLQFDIIGDGRLKPEYERMYKHLSAVKFLGPLDEPMKVLSGYDLLVVPSLSDSFPNVVLEALFLEIPVIGSYVGGIPEILCYPELLFEPDVRFLAEKLQYIIEKDELENFRQKCIERKWALTFDWGRKAREIVCQ